MNAETKSHHRRHRHSRRNLANPIFVSVLVGLALALLIGLILLLNSKMFIGPH